MKYSYSSQMGNGGLNDVHYRVQDAHDNRVATCYVEENARLVVDRMNKGEMAPHLVIAIRAYRNAIDRLKAPEVQQAWVELDRVLDEWEQLTKTPPGTE